MGGSPTLNVKGEKMAGVVESICRKMIVPKIESMGYLVLEVEYAKKIDGMNLTFTIDSDMGITIEDCEKVHKMVDAELDVINPTNDSPYILNVESAGIDRPIKTERDFLKNKGKQVEVRLYAPFNKKKKYEGALLDYNDKHVVIGIDNDQTLEFNLQLVSLITPIIKF